MNVDSESPQIQELHALYLESGIYLKYNWYDFLKKLVEIVSKTLPR